MPKKIFFFALINFVLFSKLSANEGLVCKNIHEFSNYDYNMNIEEIEIKVNNNRKWNLNGRSILIDIQKQNSSNTPGNLAKINNKFKNKFKASIKLRFKNGNYCKLKGSIRQQGDIWDHIKLLDDGNLSQSLSVTLDEGNVNGKTKFYLFLKETRSKDEIFFIEMLKKLNFLAPKSFLVKTNINGVLGEMIFQEKIAKEFLESMNRREGPLFEGRDVFRWGLTKESDNLLVSKLDLAKQTNISWAKKGQVYNEISNSSLTKINKFFLSSNLSKQINDIKINFPVINLDAKYLGNSNKSQEKIINKFNLMMFAASGLHGLVNNNRKFYWNSIKDFFEPIYYDGDLNIEEFNLTKINYNIYNYPNKKLWNELIDELIIDINDINVEVLHNNLKNLDPAQTKKIISKKKEIIINNLRLIKDNYDQLLNESSLIENQKLKMNEKVKETYLDLRNINNFKNNFLIFNDRETNKYVKCPYKKINDDCEEIILNQNQAYLILKEPIVINSKIYHYAGYLNEDDVEKFFKNKNIFLNQANIKNSILFYDDGIKIEWDKNNKILEIKQTKEDARAYFFAGDLNDLRINFYGINLQKKEFNVNEVEDRIDKRGLTGCISFVDVFFKSSSIKISNTNCEDAVNIINSTGEIDAIEVAGSTFDALDIDFSNLLINKVIVNNAGNDCVDVSYGKYNFKTLQVNNCGDKGLSIGERSYVKSNNIKVEQASIGLAVKDSSTSHLNELEISKVDSCISLYRKKQEFFGSSLEMTKFNCSEFFNKMSVDHYSNLKIIKN